jgi:hypothetical protein
LAHTDAGRTERGFSRGQEWRKRSSVVIPMSWEEWSVKPSA